MIGANLWEKHGYYIDKENMVVQENYDELPLLGKVRYNIMTRGFKIAKIKMEDINNILNE